MPAVAAIPSTGEVSLDTIKNTFGVKGSGTGYFGAGPTTATHLYSRYVPATVPIEPGSYYGLDPYSGTIPSSGTISLSQFRGTRPTAKFFCGAETAPNAPSSRRFGYGDAFWQGYDSTHSVTYTEGSRFYYPEISITSSPAMGSISYRNLLATGTNNLWITGVQCQSHYDSTGSGSFAGTCYLHIFFESSLGNNTWINSVDASFTNMYIKIGTNAPITIPFSSKIDNTKKMPVEGFSYSSSGSWYVPPSFRWLGGATSGTPGQVLTLYNQMKSAYYANNNTPCYIWFD